MGCDLSKRTRVFHAKGSNCISRDVFVRLSQLVIAVGKSTVLSELAGASLLVKLTPLGFKVVVGNVEQLAFRIKWNTLLFFSAQLFHPMSKVARTTFDTEALLFKMFANLSLKHRARWFSILSKTIDAVLALLNF